MALSLEETILILDRTPRIVRMWLEGFPSELMDADEGPGTFSPRDVVAHLVQGEEDDWMPRLRLILEHGEERPFEVFHREGFRERYRGQVTSELLDRFDMLRGQNLLALRSLKLDDAALALRGTHPDLGTVTVLELLATWVVHDLEHLGQIARVLAKHHAGDVGPWRAYLPILDR
ncbi:MAG TPA: DinB family protein [Planctomycetes bacterium]|nr:DinB family protein [Planctomycetota bacterium]